MQSLSLFFIQLNSVASLQNINRRKGYNFSSSFLIQDGNRKVLGRKTESSDLKKPKLMMKFPELPTSYEELPDELDWSNYNGHNFLQTTRNQHIPLYCGACWAFGVTAMVGDRFKVGSNNSALVSQLSPQILLNCETKSNGCEGGTPQTALKWIMTNGIVDESCQPYTASGRDAERQCNAPDICQECDGEGNCKAITDFTKYSIEEFGQVRGEKEMMRELSRGPIACGIAVNDAFAAFTGTDVFIDETNFKEIDHVVEIFGYGETSTGVKYWLGRNSWGTYWGDNGLFKILRGTNNLAIEDDCTYAIPYGVYFPEDKSAIGYKEPCRLPLNPWSQFPSRQPIDDSNFDTLRGEAMNNTKKSILKQHGTDTKNENDTLPDSPLNELTSVRTSLAPTSCKSCWAFGAASMIADRLSIFRSHKTPFIDISVQHFLNCSTFGSCNGGTVLSALEMSYERGVVDESCAVYEGVARECNIINKCKNCAPGNKEHNVVWPGNCEKQKPKIEVKISGFGPVRGKKAIQQEILARGPVSCGIRVNDEFLSYKGGVLKDDGKQGPLTTEVNIIGWDDNLEGGIWLIRNHWGSSWGHGGYGLVKFGALGVDTDCAWASIDESSI